MLILNRNISILRTALLLTAAVLICTPAFAQDRMSETAKAQIAAIVKVKQSLSAGEKKLSSGLVFSSRQALGKPLAGVPATLLRPKLDAHALVQVVVRGTAAADLLNEIAARGGHVDAVAPSRDRIEAKVPVDQLEGLAAHRDVTAIRTPPRVRKSIGSLTSQAYVSHLVKPVVEHAPFVTGNGVKVGVLSDSASLAQVAFLQSTGDLGPGTTVLPGESGEPGSDEGTAMMEIVQDLAPNSQVYFATAFTSESSFAANIVALGAAGCTVIVDDVSYSDEDPFQDSTIAQGVNTFVAAGPSNIYFSSAANSGNLTNDDSTTYEHDFVSGGPAGGVLTGAGLVHDFGGQTNNQLIDGSDVIDLFWSDPLGGSGNDYDVYVLDSGLTTIKGASFAVQDGDDDPYEEVSPFDSNYDSPAAGDRVVVALFSGSVRAFHLESFGESTWTFSTTGSAHGHNAGANTQSCAAVYWDSAHNGTKPFNGANNPTENFSSDGPRKIFFNPNGTAITPGNFLFGTNGGTTLQKPDISGADGVTTRTSGFNPFFGTSAAAPHAAGVAALIRQKNPALTNTQIANLLRGTALDNMAAGWDRDGGFGVVNATAAVNAAGP